MRINSMSKDIDTILEEKYKQIKVPHGIFHIDYSEYNKRILFFRIILIGIVVAIIMTILLYLAENNLQEEISMLISAFKIQC